MNGLDIVNISHIAKLPASKFFAGCGGTPFIALRHNPQMAKKPKIQWYAREWRKERKLTLEQAAERSGIALSYLSDLEKGERRWNEDHLNALAEAYGIDPEDLLWNPKVGPPLWRLIRNLPAPDQEQAVKILETFQKRTGTKG